MSLRSRVGGKSWTGLRRLDDGILIRSEYSDEILHRNQREDRKLECACRYLDRASRVVSNELAQQKAAIVRSLARTRRIAEMSTGESVTMRRGASAETTGSANPNRRCLNGHASRAVEEANSGGATVVRSNARSTCGPSVHQGKGSSMPLGKSTFVGEKRRTEGMDSEPRNGSYNPPLTTVRRRVRHNTD